MEQMDACFGAVMLAHIYAVSMETALIAAVILIIPDPAVLRISAGGDSLWLVLTPMAFLLKIPFAVPLLAGLAGSLLSVIPGGQRRCGFITLFLCKTERGCA